LASNPKVLLSDEATSALDPETTRSILALLREIRRELGLTIVLITHQMQVIKQVADRVAVIDAGRIVEEGPTLQVFSRPAHDITRSLLDDVLPQSLPESVLARVRALIAAGAPTGASSGGALQSHLLRLVFAGDDSQRPLLSDVIRRYALNINVLHGQIDEIQGQPFGTLAVLARGAHESVMQAIAQLRGEGVIVQEVSYV
jgi:D-methionine transport system ATP-binding protein